MNVCFTGHRPSKLPGGYYYYSPENIELGKELRTEILKLIEKGATHFICGGALGVDQMAFMVLQKLKDKGYNITVELAIPFEYQYIKWSKEQQNRHFEHISKADKVTYVDTISSYNKYLPQKTYSAQKMQLRNMYMVDNADIVIAVWNGTSGGTANCIEYAKKHGKEIVVIDKIFK